MKKLITLYMTLLLSLFLVSCGSNSTQNSIQNSIQNSDDTQFMTKVAVGSVVDGPIYNATVEFYDMNGSRLQSDPDVVKTDSEGRYSATVMDMPKHYRVVVRDGSDSGVDGTQNANDENNSIIMSAIVTRDDSNDSNESVGHVTPATTLVDSIVEDGALPLDDAQKLVKEQMGVELDDDLAKLDPRKHDLVNKLGNFIALLVKMTPSDNRQLSFKAVAKIVIKKKIKVKISNRGLDIDQFKFSDIANEAIELGAEVSQEDIAKMQRVESIIKEQLETLMRQVKTVAVMSDEEKKEALVAYDALFELLGKVHETNFDALNEEELKLYLADFQIALKAILDDAGIDDMGVDDVDFVSNLVKENLGESIDAYKIKVVKAHHDYKLVIKFVTGKEKQKVSLKKVIKLIYKNSNLDALTYIQQALANEESLAELLNSIEELLAQSDSDELQALLEDVLAAKMAQTIEEKKGNVDPEDIKNDSEKTVKNVELVSTLKVKIKIKTTIKVKKGEYSKSDRVKLVVVDKVLQDIKINIKVKVFTKVSSQSSEDMYQELLAMLESLTDQQNALQDQIDALDLFVSNLSQEFEPVEFKEQVAITVKIVETIKVDSSSDSSKTLIKLKLVAQEKFVVSTDAGIVSINEEEVKENSIPIEENSQKIIILPQPKVPSMPTDMLSNIKIAI